MMDSTDDRLKARASLFDSIVALIPPRFYLPVPESTAPPRFIHNKREKAPKQAIKEGTQKARRLKLDPTAFKSVLDLQAEESAAVDVPPSAEEKSPAALSASELGTLIYIGLNMSECS